MWEPGPKQQQDPRIVTSHSAPGLEEPPRPPSPAWECPGSVPNPRICHGDDECYSRWARRWFRYSVCPAASEGKISRHRSQAGAASGVGSGPSSSAQPGVQHVCEGKRDLGTQRPPGAPWAHPPNLIPLFLCWAGARAVPHPTLHKSHRTIPVWLPSLPQRKPGGKLAPSTKLEHVCHLSLCHCHLSADRVTQTWPLFPLL